MGTCASVTGAIVRDSALSRTNRGGDREMTRRGERDAPSGNPPTDRGVLNASLGAVYGAGAGREPVKTGTPVAREQCEASSHRDTAATGGFGYSAGGSPSPQAETPSRETTVRPSRSITWTSRIIPLECFNAMAGTDTSTVSNSRN